MVLAVAHDEERARALVRRARPVRRRRIERLTRDRKRGREVGALDRDLLGIDGLEEEADGRAVGRERALQERLAGEDHEPDAVAAARLHDALDLQRRTVEAARGDVLGPHRVRDVEGDHEVEALGRGVARRRAEARAGEGDAERAEGGRGEGRAERPQPHERRQAGCVLGRARAEKQAQRLAAPPGGVERERDGGRHEGDREDEEPGRAERHHGTRRRRVLDSTAAAPRHSRAGQSATRYSSSTSSRTVSSTRVVSISPMAA